MTYTLLPPAATDLRTGATFYRENHSAALARGFLGEVDRTIERLLAFPDLGSPAAKGTRRSLVRRFPYAVIYLVEADRLVVVAIAHHSREPGYWLDRL